MTSCINKHIEDLYHLRITLKEILEKEGISRSKLRKDMKELGLLTPQQWYREIDTGIADLDIHMQKLYSNLVKRCKGQNKDKYSLKHYKGLEYLAVNEWVEFCNQNKDRLIDLREKFTNSGNNLKWQITTDRIDNDKGYTLDNIQFVHLGFNSWKRNINPLRVRKVNKDWLYFMSGEEASKYFGIRRQTMGDLLRGHYREVGKQFEVEKSTIDEVLKATKTNTLEDYYYSLQEEGD